MTGNGIILVKTAGHRLGLFTVLLFTSLTVSSQQHNFFQNPDTVVEGRVWALGIGSAAIYGSSLLVLNQYWYKDYAKRNFHTINDSGEWLQMDKFGHVYTTYLFSKYSREIWRWSGLPSKQQIWIGGLSGFAYQSVIELLDAHSTHWGFSWSDMGANALGSAVMISQELIWNEPRFQLKFSYFPVNYNDPALKARAIDQFGERFAERTLKDYNAQTYWLSVNPWSFAKESNFPKWLNIAVGYGTEGLYDAKTNDWTDEHGVRYDYTHIHRTRQFYLSPDIDFTKIPTRRKGIRVLFQVLNMIKVPAPALEISSAGKLKAHALYF